MKKIILTLCFFIPAMGLLGQEITLPEIFPPSPTASELGKYGTYPVNLSTGLPTIEIPLYTIKSGDIQVPITLKYHASGIKVNQMPTWVGLGWSLDTGGLISLETRDTPDEVEPNPYSIPNLQYLLDIVANDPYNFSHPDIKNAVQNSWVKDAYHISLPTVSGTFFLGSNTTNEITAKFPPEEYKVFSGHLAQDGYLYKVIDKQGMQYDFKDVEYSRLNKTIHHEELDMHIYNKNYKSAWLLNTITDTKGNTVNYTYGYNYTALSIGQNHSMSYSYTEGRDPIYYYQAAFNPWSSSLSSSATFGNKLQEITFPNGRIRFNIGTNPQFEGVEEQAGIYLQSMVVEEGDTVSGYRPIKTLFFTYSITGDPTHYPSTNSDRYRFTLDKITEFKGVEYKEIASFEYSPVQLPKSRSYAIDYFGLFNGKNNENLIPTRYIAYKPTTYGGTRPERIGLADRSIDPDKMKAGMLTKISYPTKGYTEFEYEPNSFYGKNQFLKDEYVSQSLSIYGTGDGSLNPAINPDCLIEPDYGSCNIQTKYITFSTSVATSLSLTGTRSCSSCTTTNSKYSYAKLQVINNGQVIYSTSGYNNEVLEMLNVQPGSVNVTLEVYGAGIEANIKASYWNRLGNLPDENVQGFGLRVKSITNYDHDDTFINKKEYTYTTPDTDNSSGKLINNDSKYDRLSQYRYYQLEACYEFLIDSKTDTYTYSSSSRSGFENNSIAYEYITELDKDALGNSKGKTLYKYTTTANNVADPNGSLWVNLGHKRGQLLEKKVFDSQDRILQFEENFYTEDTSKSSARQDFKAYDHGSSNIVNNQCILTDIPISLSTSKSFFNTAFTVYWFKKHKTEFTEYFYEGSTVSTLKTTTHYTYSNQNQEVITTTTTNSQNEAIENSYKYAHDLGNQTLIDQNRIAVPLETTNSKNSQIVFNQRTKYAPYGGLYLPSEVFIKKDGLADLNSTTDRRLVYDNYDDKGNITQYHLENGIYTSVIWGYYDQYPIVKLENTTLAGLTSAQQNLINVAKAASNSDTTPATENNLRTLLNNLRDGFPNAMVTTYTYDPLVGVTSVTDPKEQTIYYEYDDFNRLEFVKDHEGNLISENKYRYKNQ